MTDDSMKRKIERTTEYERTKYFKTLVRFPSDKEDEIREAVRAYDPERKSLNGYIVAAVLEKMERDAVKAS